jgi:hypothetical protein
VRGAGGDPLTGGCLCGAIRYEVRGAPRVLCLCHCTLCRRSVGATPVAWATFPTAQLRIEAGTLAWFRSSAIGRRGFCARCGASLVFENTHTPAEIDVTIASLDDPDRLPPERHIWVPDRVAWVASDDGLPRHGGDSDSPLLP